MSQIIIDENFLAYEHETTGENEILKGKNGAVNVNMIANSTSNSPPIQETPISGYTVLVSASDISGSPLLYTSDSLGQIKTIKEASRYSPTIATTTTYQYAFTGVSVVIPSSTVVTTGAV